MHQEPLSKALPRAVFPYFQQWAERSGLPVVARLLADEQLRALIAKYGGELEARLARPRFAHGNGNCNGRRTDAAPVPPAQPQSPAVDEDRRDWSDLLARVRALEAQLDAQSAGFEVLRSKAGPLARALGSCPECFVGIEGCRHCAGQGSVGYDEPDYNLLATQVLHPLAARGVPVSIRQTPPTVPHSTKPTSTTKRNKPCPKK